MEQTLVLIKPDAVQRALVGEIISRFEKCGLKIVATKMVWEKEDFFEKHYHDVEERHGREILDGNLKAMTAGPVFALVLEGIRAIEIVRKLVGPTEPKKAAPGTIRGDYTHYTYELADHHKVAVKNIVHASSSIEDAQYEINLWFQPKEIHSYETVHEKHVFR
ncbi:MAG: nucleoside-diphosphate kinase [Candidatus Woesearchaeota archaeon]